jgi:hypothetical protein
MEEGKEFLRSFGDLMQFHQKKKEQPKPADDTETAGNSNGASQDSSEQTSGELHGSEQSSGS